MSTNEAEDDDEMVVTVSKVKPFRQCDIQLSFCGGSIFGDLKMVIGEKNQRQYQLTKMSFDGYGCCMIGSSNLMFSEEDTAELESLFKDDKINRDEYQEPALKIFRKYFNNEFRGYLWEDAMLEYKLIDPVDA